MGFLKNLRRFAGDVFDDTINAKGTGKAAALSTTGEVGAFDGKEQLGAALNVARSVGSALHPTLSVADDTYSATNHFKGALLKNQGIQAKAGSVANGLHSAASVATAGGPLAAAAPIVGLAGPALAVGIPAAQRMTDDKIRQPDIEQYRKMKEFFGK